MKNQTEINMIPLIDNYSFSCDENQYILYYQGTRNKIDIKTKKETGDVINYTETVGFYYDLKAMLKGCVRHYNMMNIRTGKITTIEECIRHIDNTYLQLENLSKGF